VVVVSAGEPLSHGYSAVMSDDRTSGPAPTELGDHDLLRELKHLHETRHEAFLHGSDAALTHHSERTIALEQEYIRRRPQRAVEDDRLRAARRDG
jgi:hypothetical protein